MTPQEQLADTFNRNHICTLQVTERMVYEAPRPYVHYDRLALVWQDGTILHEGSTDAGNTFPEFSAMLHQIVLNA